MSLKLSKLCIILVNAAPAGSPRLVTHVDDAFLRRVTQLYRQRIPEGGAVLDLMSSWVSHLPPEEQYERVVGHGMNAAEVRCGTERQGGDGVHVDRSMWWGSCRPINVRQFLSQYAQ